MRNFSDTMKKAAVLWTGGKDSALAFQVSLNLYDIKRLVCSISADNRRFYAHPTELMELQARKTRMHNVKRKQINALIASTSELAQACLGGCVWCLRLSESPGFQHRIYIAILPQR